MHMASIPVPQQAVRSAMTLPAAAAYAEDLPMSDATARNTEAPGEPNPSLTAPLQNAPPPGHHQGWNQGEATIHSSWSAPNAVHPERPSSNLGVPPPRHEDTSC